MTEQAEIALRIERATAVDWLNALLNAPLDVVESTGLQIQKFGEAFAVAMPKQKDYPVNGTNATGIFEPATEALLDGYTAFFQKVGCGFGVSVSPVSQPDALRDWLQERGYTRGGRVPILYRRAAYPPPAPELPDGLRIKRIGPELALAWKETFGKMYVAYLTDWMTSLVGAPGRFHYLAFDGEIPVAASQMSVTDRVGFPHFTFVLPEYRGRGLQQAFTAQRIRDAAEAGCEWLASTADEDTPEEPGYSLRNLIACGFALLHYSQGYDAPAQTLPSQFEKTGE